MAPRTLIVIGDVRQDDALPGPRKDYACLADALDADVLDPSQIGAAGGRFRAGAALARAASAAAARYDSIYCDSEHIAMPLAWLLAGKRSRPRLTCIAHYLTPLKKRALCRILRVARAVDAVALHSPGQLPRALACGFRPDQIRLVPYQVDADFWRPAADEPRHIVSVGQEFRDYRTLVEAARGLELPVEIAAGSLWSTRDLALENAALPDNVRAGRRPYTELRALYAASHFVVVPLHDVDFQAGIIAILEAMAMGKAVIVSRTRGQTGVVSGRLLREGGWSDIGENAWPLDTGMYVPPGDPVSLRQAMRYLMERPDVAHAMGEAGRAHVEANFTLELFTERIAAMARGGEQAAAPS